MTTSKLMAVRDSLDAILRLCSGEDQPDDNEQADCTEDCILTIEKLAKDARALINED